MLALENFGPLSGRAGKVDSALTKIQSTEPKKNGNKGTQDQTQGD